jgi:hypothetical protein
MLHRRQPIFVKMVFGTVTVKVEGFYHSANAVDKRKRSGIATAINQGNMLILAVFSAVNRHNVAGETIHLGTYNI